MHPGIILVSVPHVTHRKSRPTALVATAATAVIVLQAQEHQRREEHLPAREAPQGLGREGGPVPAWLGEGAQL